MVSKKNFQQNGRQMPQYRAAAPYKKPFKTGNQFNQIMFNASQIPDNPGYMDFNNPTPPTPAVPVPAVISPQVSMQQKKKPIRNKQKGKQIPPPPQQQQQFPPHGGNASWNKGKNTPHNATPNRFIAGPQHTPRFAGAPAGPNRGRRIMPRGAPMPMPPIPHAPIIPPIPHIGRGLPPPPPMGAPPPHFLRRNIRGPMPIPPPMPPMVAPRMPRGPPIIPFNPLGKINKKTNPKVLKKVIKGKSTIKTLKNLVNQYPLDKPWVTEDIRTEHGKKIDIENRLKGNKDDDLFAQFKIQRDKFVAMYEAAREEYLKQEAAAVKSKDAKDKQTITNMTAAKDGNSKEAIST